MAVEDRNRWNQKHAASADGETPSPFLQHILESHAWGIMPGKALDLASGKGRNAMLLATRGFDVTAIDISSVGLAEASRRARQRSLSIDWLKKPRSV